MCWYILWWLQSVLLLVERGTLGTTTEGCTMMCKKQQLDVLLCMVGVPAGQYTFVSHESTPSGVGHIGNAQPTLNRHKQENDFREH